MSPDYESVGSDVLHVYVQGVELNTNDLMVFEISGANHNGTEACSFRELRTKKATRVNRKGERTHR